MSPEFIRALALYAVVLAAALVLYALLAEDRSLPRAAKRQARKLFLSKLSRRQRVTWQLLRRFEVTAPSGRRYTIAPYQSFNVRTAEAAFCLQVAGRIPAYDKLLAQKLLIEADEERFLAVANRRGELGILPTAPERAGRVLRRRWLPRD